MTKSPQTLARSLLTALETGNFAPWQAVLAPGFTCSYPGLRGSHGAAEALAFNQVFPAAFPDLKFTITAEATSGPLVFLSWSATGTHKGPLAGPEGALPPTGRKGTVTGVLVAKIEAGHILREESFWNIPDLIAQLMPQQAAA